MKLFSQCANQQCMKVCRFFSCVLASAVCLPLSAAETPSTMTRMVVRLMGPNIKPGSIAAMPRTIYEALPGYGRIEDPPDSRQKMQKLTLFAGRDAYSANLIDKTGTHSRNAGAGAADEPHLPIVLPFDPKHKLGKLDRLQFGAEYDFFTQAGATKSAGPIINSQPTDELRWAEGAASATLVLRGGVEIPIKLSWQASDGVYSYEYIEYADVPFDVKLFQKPEGVRFRELPADGTRDEGPR